MNQKDHKRATRLVPLDRDSAGPGVFIELGDGGFLVASREHHEHWPPKQAPLTLKAVLEGQEEYYVGNDR